jgi:hypothetical protein
MTWPFPENKPNPNPAEVGGDGKPPDTSTKTPAELIADALKPLVDSQTAFQTKLDERLTLLENQTKPAPRPQPQPNEPISVLDDENAAFAQRMTPIFARQLELEGRVVKNDIKGEYAAAGYGELWAQYENEINSILDASPLVDGNGKTQRGDPQYIRNVVDMVLGRAARKAGMRFDGKSKGFFLETGGSGSDAPPADKVDGMNESQRRVVQRMGIPLDKAKETMKKLVMVN